MPPSGLVAEQADLFREPGTAAGAKACRRQQPTMTSLGAARQRAKYLGRRLRYRERPKSGGHIRYSRNWWDWSAAVVTRSMA
jgi:hypothetical protein